MPQTDIFGRSAETVGFTPITFAEATINIGGNASIGMLAQQVSIQYSAPNDIIREIGSKNYYYAEKLPTVQVQISRLVGKGKDISTFFNATFWQGPSDGSPGGGILIQSTEGDFKYIIVGCIIVDFGVNAGSGDEYVQENIVLQGVSLLDG